MLKILRKGAIENVWFYRVIMVVLSLAFVITMGWWGFSSPAEQHVVAKVGSAHITLEQYQKAYENAYKFYRDMFKDQFNEEMVKQLNLKNTVIHELVDRQLWILAAQQLKTEVGDHELSDFILKQQAFQRDGKFDPEVYRRVLARNRLTPEGFEKMQREEMAIEKVKSILRASVTVTDLESQELTSHAVSSQTAATPSNQERIQGLLMHKQQMALGAYLNFMKSQVPVTIDEKIL